MCLVKRIFHKDDVLIMRLQEKTKQLSIRLHEIKEQRRIELEICIKPRDPEKVKKKRGDRYASMTLEMYNSKVSEQKKLKSVRSKPSLASPKNKVEKKPVVEAKKTPRIRKKRLVMKRSEFKAVREAAGRDDLTSATSRTLETQIESIPDGGVSCMFGFQIVSQGGSR